MNMNKIYISPIIFLYMALYEFLYTALYELFALPTFVGLNVEHVKTSHGHLYLKLQVL